MPAPGGARRRGAIAAAPSRGSARCSSFQPTRAMPIGHVAVVAEIVDDRQLYLNHANWSGPGRIERRALAEDVSANGDWSMVRVWYAPQRSLGIRANPAFGFIYNEAPGEAAPAVTPADDDRRRSPRQASSRTARTDPAATPGKPTQQPG